MLNLLDFFLIFTASCLVIVWGGKMVVNSLSFIARFLGWKEFVVAFFAFSLGAVAPEFFIGLTSALHGIPELSLGNIIGQNILLLSFTVAVSAFILRDGIRVESQTVKAGSTFAVLAAILPLLMILDGHLSRIDGLILILFFLGFTLWLFSRKERFSKVYENQLSRAETFGRLGEFFRNCFWLLSGLLIILLSAQGIIRSAVAFSESLNFSLPLIGLLIVALGTGLPETFVAINLARRGQSWMILGGLMGSVALSSTLVLGLVALIRPITVEISLWPQLALARMFLLICALLFLFFLRTGRAISNREAVLLLLIYFLFLFLSLVIS